MNNPTQYLRRIPYERNPNFIERPALLRQLREMLLSNHRAILVPADSSLSGVGKTQLVIEYLYRFQHEYQTIWWLRAGQIETLEADYADLAVKLGLAGSEEKQPAQIEKTRRWLELSTGWLLIFDNLEDLGEMRSYDPFNQKGQAIVTSGNTNLRGLFSPRHKMIAIQVGLLERQETTDFLLKQTGFNDPVTAGILAAALHDAPLALDLAGAYIKAAGCQLVDYSSLFHNYLPESAQNEQPTFGFDYQEILAATFQLTFDRIQRENALGADLLKLLAFLAPEELPFYRLQNGAVNLPQALAEVVADELKLTTILESLERYSLLKTSPTGLEVHNIIQALIRECLDVAESKKWIIAAVKLVQSVFPSQLEDIAGQRADELPIQQALAVIGYAEEAGLLGAETIQLMKGVGLYWQSKSYTWKARNILEKAAKLAETEYGPKHQKTVSCFNNLNVVLGELAERNEASALKERASAIFLRLYYHQSYYPNIAIYAGAAGNQPKNRKILQEAQLNFERVLEINGKFLGLQHPSLTSLLSELGFVLKSLGDLSGARTCYERAISIEEAFYRPSRYDIAEQINNLGLVLYAAGDLQAAKASFEKSLKLIENEFGSNHPDVAVRLNNLGLVLKDLGDMPGAKANLEQALRIDEEIYKEKPKDSDNLSNETPRHKRLADYLDPPEDSREAIFAINLGLVLRAIGDLAGAKANFERALQFYQRFPKNKGYTHIAQHNLGEVEAILKTSTKKKTE
jgi:hypothetical protein